MIWLLFLLPISLGLIGTVVNLRERRTRRHADCLRSINKLERELFPEWNPPPIVTKYIQARDFVQTIPNAYGPMQHRASLRGHG